MTNTVLTLVPADSTTDRMHSDDLDQVIAEHNQPLLRYVLRLTFGDLHLAEDIVQETLLRIWQRPKTITTSHSSLRPWLFTVARNLFYDHKRARNARPTEVYDAPVEDRPVVADLMEATLDHVDMKRALDRLSGEHRVVVAHVYYRGKSLADTATELNLPLGTVKSRLYYALRALREIVADLGIARPAGSAPDELPCAS